MISAGLNESKKPFMDTDIENLYLNYGLLGLGSNLYSQGFTNVKMFQGDTKSTCQMFEEILDNGIVVEELQYPVFISIPSFFSVPWAIEFIDKLKQINHSIKVILGGRWVLDKNTEWCKNKFKQVDFFCLGCPDESIDKLLDPANWCNFNTPQIYNHTFTNFHYKILNNYKIYQPVIELCRGCGQGCAFCLEKKYPTCTQKSATNVIEEAQSIIELYESEHLNFYFEASMFNPSVQWAEEFRNYYTRKNMKFKWRFTTRVDTLNVKSVEILSEVGLVAIDLGLESASITQLIRMDKSKKPVRYLEKADLLLRKMHQVGVFCKLNLLLYLGETYTTIEETRAWLNERKELIKGVSVNPLIVYLNGDSTQGFIDEIEKEPTVKVNKISLNQLGYTYTDLSNEINIEDSWKISNDLSSEFMTDEDCLILKNICYTPRPLI